MALECPDPAVLAFRVRLLNRVVERAGSAPSAPRPRPVLTPPHHASSAAQAAKVQTLVLLASDATVNYCLIVSGSHTRRQKTRLNLCEASVS